MFVRQMPFLLDALPLRKLTKKEKVNDMTEHYAPGEKAWVKNFHNNPAWLTAFVFEECGEQSCVTVTHDRSRHMRQVDHVKKMQWNIETAVQEKPYYS